MDVKDKSCIEECPVDCIYEGGRMLYIQPDECVDCGACEPVCPTVSSSLRLVHLVALQKLAQPELITQLLKRFHLKLSK